MFLRRVTVAAACTPSCQPSRISYLRVLFSGTSSVHGKQYKMDGRFGDESGPSFVGPTTALASRIRSPPDLFRRHPDGDRVFFVGARLAHAGRSGSTGAVLRHQVAARGNLAGRSLFGLRRQSAACSQADSFHLLIPCLFIVIALTQLGHQRLGSLQESLHRRAHLLKAGDGQADRPFGHRR